MLDFNEFLEVLKRSFFFFLGLLIVFRLFAVNEYGIFNKDCIFLLVKFNFGLCWHDCEVLVVIILLFGEVGGLDLCFKFVSWSKFPSFICFVTRNEDSWNLLLGTKYWNNLVSYLQRKIPDLAFKRKEKRYLKFSHW